MALVQLLLASSAHSPATQQVLAANVTGAAAIAKNATAVNVTSVAKHEEEVKAVAPLPAAPAAAPDNHIWIVGNATFPHRVDDKVVPGRELNISEVADEARDTDFHMSIRESLNLNVTDGSPLKVHTAALNVTDEPMSTTPSTNTTAPTAAPSAAAAKESIGNQSAAPNVQYANKPASDSGGGQLAKQCFARDTIACRVIGPASPNEAYAQCFGASIPTTAERTPMHTLLAGDLVLSLGSDGDFSIERVVVNQHRLATSTAPLVALGHAEGSLTVTADHALWIDGRFDRADAAMVGSKLRTTAGEAAVERVSQVSSGRVVNPVTSSGTVLAADPHGRGVPVFASTHPEHLVKHMLSSAVPFPCSLFNLCSFLWPRTFQACYETAIEPLADAHADAINAVVGPHTPAVVRVAAFLLADLAFAAVFCAFTAPTLSALALAALVARGVSRQCRPKCRK